MKRFFIAFYYNIKDMWQSHKFILLLINLSIFFSFTFMLIAFNRLNYALFSEDINVYKSYQFVFDVSGKEIQKEKIDSFINSNRGIRNVFFTFRCDGDTLPDENKDYFSAQDMVYEKIYALYSGDFTQNVQTYEGRWFTSEELSIGAKVVVVPNRKAFLNSGVTSPEYNIGDKFIINGEEYTIIGKNNFLYDYAFVVPYNSIENTSSFLRFNLTLDKKYSNFKVSNFAEKVKSHFDIQPVKLAEGKDFLIEIGVFTVYLVLLNLSIKNICYIFEFMIKGRNNALYTIFQKQGIKKEKYNYYLMLECMICFIINMVLSVIVSNLFLLIAGKFGMTVDSFTLTEYALIFVGFLAVYIYKFLPIIDRLTDNMKEIIVEEE